MQIAFRLDASRELGIGHAMRCLTLADALRAAGAHIRFVCSPLPDSVRNLLGSRGHEVAELAAGKAEDAAAAIALLSDRRWDWLIVDHYGLDARFEREMRSVAARVFVIDDVANRSHDCDLLLDQNFYANPAQRYHGRVPSGCRTLLGPRFALLRPEFASLHETTAPRAAGVRAIIVFFGGMDAEDLTSVAVTTLAAMDLPGIRVDVVVGAEHARRDALAGMCADHGFTLHAQTARMAELMAGADLAIGAGGSATWERCCVGLACITFAIADNQRELVDDGARAGFLYAPASGAREAGSLGRHLTALLDNPRLIHSLSARGHALVDGRGLQRVVRAMGLSRVTMRRATAADSRRVFEWRNDARVRAVSRSTGEIEWDSHCAWFDKVLADPARILLIGEDAGEPVGVVRFDIAATRAEVSIYNAPGAQRAGTGADLLAAAQRWLGLNAPGVECLDAEVLGDNRPSRALFEGAGFDVSTTRYSRRTTPC